MSLPNTKRPMRTRYILVLWLCGLTAILYLDRICMSQAVVPIQNELKLSNSQISYVLMAFTLAYGLFEIPTGRLGDRHGSRSVLTRIAIWWSVFTALTGACTGFITLFLVRFLFGAGEAGALPNAARVISRWFPISERGRVQGVMLASMQLGAVIAPAGAAYLIDVVGWRWSFAVFGALGVVWSIGFWFWFRDEPADHPRMTPEELREIRANLPLSPPEPGPIPWRAVLVNRGIIVLGLIMILSAFYSYFFFSWFQKYLNATRGVENIRAGWLASYVMAGSAVGILMGGWLADRVPRWFAKPIAARRYFGSVCYLLAAGGLFLGIRCDDPVLLATLCGASCLAMFMTIPNWWSVAIPQSGPHVGALCGLMNGVGVIGAMASQWFVGVYADWRASLGYTGRAQWDPLFDVYVGVLLIGAVAWWAYQFCPLADYHDEETAREEDPSS